MLHFRAALKKLNTWITADQLLEAQSVLEKRLSTSSLLQINEEKYFLIRDGIPDALAIARLCMGVL